MDAKKKKPRGKKKKVRTRESRQGRLNIIIDPDLKTWAHEYAAKHHTTVTALITSFLRQKRENVIDVQQI